MKMNLKIYFLSLLLLTPHAGHALTVTVKGVNGEVLLQKQTPARGTVGSLTNRVLSQALHAGVLSEYNGSRKGVISIDQLGDATETLENNDLNAYGWCYSINGKTADVMSNQYRLTGQEADLTWFYVEAERREGIWVSMCTPADHLPQPKN